MAKFQTATVTLTFNKAVKDANNNELSINDCFPLDQLLEIVENLVEDKSIIIELDVK